MKYILDTDTVSELYGKPTATSRKISEKLLTLNNDDDIFISILTVYELKYGYEHAPDALKHELFNKITEIKNDFQILQLSENGADYFGKLKSMIVRSRDLKKEEAKKHNIDLMLASLALVENATIISTDKIYQELAVFNPELKLADWTKKN